MAQHSDHPLTNLARPRPPAPESERVYFLADVHLGAGPHEVEDAKEEDLCRFLEWLRGRATHLYLVGDIFDFWFEYPTVSPHAHFRTLKSLAGLSEAGVRLRFLGGNHDYWAGEQLEDITGAVVHRDSLEVTHCGLRLFIAHGDGLPRGDWGYRVLKAVIRSDAAIAAFRLLHPTVGSHIARWASGLSTITEERIQRAIPPMEAFLSERLRSGFDAVVVGHVHRPLIQRWSHGTGIIIGDWMANRAVVALDEDGFHMLRWTGDGLVETVKEGEPATR